MKNLLVGKQRVAMSWVFITVAISAIVFLVNPSFSSVGPGEGVIYTTKAVE